MPRYGSCHVCVSLVATGAHWRAQDAKPLLPAKATDSASVNKGKRTPSLLRARDRPISLSTVTLRERRGEWGCSRYAVPCQLDVMRW